MEFMIERKKTVYQPGRGIIGRVVETGEQVFFPKIASSHEFLKTRHL